MENLILIILIILIILVFYFLNKPIKKKNIKKIQKIDTNNIYTINDYNNHNDIIYKNDNEFYKEHYNKNNSEQEIKQINIDKGKITRQSILDETGGSIHYDNLKINSNISGNTIKPNLTLSTYAKLPSNINV